MQINGFSHDQISTLRLGHQSGGIRPPKHHTLEKKSFFKLTRWGLVGILLDSFWVTSENKPILIHNKFVSFMSCTIPACVLIQCQGGERHNSCDGVNRVTQLTCCLTRFPLRPGLEALATPKEFDECSFLVFGN